MKKFLPLFAALVASLSAGAIEQDNDGYYLIGSVADWDAFAAIVAETPEVNARMTANVNLGNDQTMIAENGYFSGISDGQYHTLTVAYNSTHPIAPFSSIKDATIKNLHVDGSIHSTSGPLSGLALHSLGIENISTVWISANVTSSSKANDWSCFGVVVGYANSNTTYVNITDCLFSGTVATYGKQNGAFMGYDGYTNKAKTTNCLSIGTFDYYSTASAYFPGEYENTYFKQFKVGYNTNAIPEEMQCTDEQLADGTITTALQAGRDEVVWAQDPDSGTPMLAMFYSIEQDEDGYYLIGSIKDWKAFAEIVATTNDAKARMTADVDLGSDQTTIGHPNENPSYHFKGVFDGQGHTLTVHYVPQGSKDICSPFPNISEATIKNLHIDGTIESTTACQPAAIGVARYGTSTIERVWSSVEITSTKSSWCEASGLVGCVDGYKSGHLIMTDCMVSGTVNSSGSFEGCFIGYINGGGSATVSNCLSVATFNYSGTSGFMGNYTNCYVKQFPSSIPQAMQCTSEQLVDGTIATALQAGRQAAVWVQDPERGMPMLRIFTDVVILGDVNYDGIMNGADVTALYSLLLDGTPVVGEADINGDGIINGADVTALYNLLLQ